MRWIVMCEMLSGRQRLTAFRNMRSEINVNSMFGTEVSVVSQCSAHAAAPTATGLVAALLLVDVWTDVAMTSSKWTP